MELKGQAKKDFDKWANKKSYFLLDPHDGKCWTCDYLEWKDVKPAMQYGVYIEYIREERNVLINAYRNGSGYLWQMEEAESGTSLGWCEFTGDDPESGTFTSYDKAIEDAIMLELSGGLEEFKKDVPPKKFHWGNYAGWLIDNNQKDGNNE